MGYSNVPLDFYHVQQSICVTRTECDAGATSTYKKPCVKERRMFANYSFRRERTEWVWMSIGCARASISPSLAKEHELTIYLYHAYYYCLVNLKRVLLVISNSNRDFW